MSTICFKSNSYHTYGELPAVGSQAPNFQSTQPDLSIVSLHDFIGKPVLLNVYPSIETQICFSSAVRFKQALPDFKESIVACISMDLPFTLSKARESEHLEDLMLLSDFRNREFGDFYGLTIADGPLAGLLARAIVVLDSQHKVVHTELVSNISEPPDYDEAITMLAKVAK